MMEERDVGEMEENGEEIEGEHSQAEDCKMCLHLSIILNQRFLLLRGF